MCAALVLRERGVQCSNTELQQFSELDVNSRDVNSAGTPTR
jgi:hypothetical protein